MCALPRSKPLRFMFSGIPQRHRLPKIVKITESKRKVVVARARERKWGVADQQT